MAERRKHDGKENNNAESITQSSQTLYRKYRPRKFKEVVGQDAVVEVLQRIIEKGTVQAFLFCGPSGCGKTTLARIVARKMGCSVHGIMEVAAAKYTGVEDMRRIQDTLDYKPFDNSDRRAIILDECHRLSKNAWDALLKPIEEPPAHVLWLLCTTEPGKVPYTIKTRCTMLTLKAVPERDLINLVQSVASEERMNVPDDVVDIIVKEANGSPRQVLVNLDLCRGISTRKEAARILKSAHESDATIELCRFLLNGGSWSKAMKLVNELSEENPESVRIVVCNYMASVLRNTDKNEQATRVLGILDAFSTPYNSSEQSAPLILSIGRALFT